jgi:hypothetical protein
VDVSVSNLKKETPIEISLSVIKKSKKESQEQKHNTHKSPSIIKWPFIIRFLSLAYLYFVLFGARIRTIPHECVCGDPLFICPSLFFFSSFFKIEMREREKINFFKIFSNQIKNKDHQQKLLAS